MKGRLLLRMAEFCPTLLSTCAAASSEREEPSATPEDKLYPNPAAHHPCRGLPPTLVPEPAPELPPGGADEFSPAPLANPCPTVPPTLVPPGR